MTGLHWELSTLGRAVAYKNLSLASHNIGISQPQLSRIVARLEHELKVVLLDRTSRRKSGWTPVAFQLAEFYSKYTKRFERELLKVAGQVQVDRLKIGTLEGLISLSLAYCDLLFKDESLKHIDLDVHDLSRLEELFAKGEFDLIFVSREPVGRKPRYSQILGHQSLERVKTSDETLVISSFESQTHARLADEKVFPKVLVSNSLLARRQWVEKYGGSGVIPSKVFKGKPAGEGSEPVVLMGSEFLPEAVWERISSSKLFKNPS